MSQLGMITSSLTLIEKSLAIWRAIAAARNFGSDAAQAVMMLRFEAFRYVEWTTGNENLQAILKAPREEPKTHAILSTATWTSPATSTRQALHDAIWQVVEVLESVDKLLSRYNRAFESRDQSEPSLVSELSTIPVLGIEGQQASVAGAADEFRGLKDNLQSKTNFFRRVKYGIATWNEADKETLKGLITRFKYWNDALAEIAPCRNQKLLALKLSLDVVGRSVRIDDLDNIEAAAVESQYESVSRSAHTKKAKSVEESDESLRKEYSDVQINGKVSKSRRFLTTYTQKGKGSNSSFQPVQWVLVEWYFYDEKWKPEQVSLAHSRVEQLARQLSVTKKPNSLRVLDCIGYICHPDKHDRALLYRLPPNPSPEKCLPISLFELLSPKKDSPNPTQTPSLERRFQLAALLAISLLEFHNVDWVHKSLNAYNILFLTDGNGGVQFSKPYIIGFDFSRPDKPGGKSLTIRSSILDIYRHPEARRVSHLANQAQVYKKEFDVYSLGLILFEIGLWRRLDEFLKPNLTPDALKERIVSYVLRDMSLWMGETYKKVILHCLSGDYSEKVCTIALATESTEEQVLQEGEDRTKLEEEEEEEEEETNMPGLNGFYRYVVSELGRCQCGRLEG